MRFPLLATSCAAVLCAFGCASPQKTIMSEPPGASVTVNDEPAGLTPLKYDFDFGKRIKYDVVVRKDGFIPGEQVVYSDTVLAQQAVLQFQLKHDPSWEDTTESEIANQWLDIQINPQIAPEVWRRLIETVATRYRVQTMDQTAGYIDTISILKTYTVNGESYSIRTSFIATIASTDPLVYKVKIISERSSAPDQWVPWHRVFNEDQKLIDQLQERLGIK